MSELTEQPELPAAYQLVYQDSVDDLRRHACQAAIKGAEEGTIIVARSQSAARGCGDKPWQALQGNLHVALILQPEIEVARYVEMLYVAVISMGHAIATHVAPMTALSYTWPNDIRIARHKIASVWLDYGETADAEEKTPWIVITSSVNIASAPEDMMMEAMSLHEAEGESTLTPLALLETWARQFMAQINDWDDRGFEHIIKLWKVRADAVGASVNLQLGSKLVSGTVTDVNDSGDLVIEPPKGAACVVAVNEYMGWNSNDE